MLCLQLHLKTTFEDLAKSGKEMIPFGPEIETSTKLDIPMRKNIDVRKRGFGSVIKLTSVGRL